MESMLKKVIYIMFIILFANFTNSQIYKIDPNNIGPISYTSKNIDKKCNFKLENTIVDTSPLMKITTAGYLTISTINRVIVYPYSPNDLTLQLFYKNGFLLIKDQNNLEIWNYKLEIENNEERELLTFINRGNLLARDQNNERIYPYHDEKLNKKINLNFNKGNLELTDENKNKIWSTAIDKQNIYDDEDHFIKREELIKI